MFHSPSPHRRTGKLYKFTIYAKSIRGVRLIYDRFIKNISIFQRVNSVRGGMAFKITGVNFQEKHYSLCNEDSTDNTFTIITGKNGSGKSNILTRCVNPFIFTQEENAGNFLQYTSPASQVIVVSTSRNDRFPNPVHFEMKKQDDVLDKYACLNSHTAGGNYHFYFEGLLTKVLEQTHLFQNDNGIDACFDELNIAPVLKGSFRFNRSNALKLRAIMEGFATSEHFYNTPTAEIERLHSERSKRSSYSTNIKNNATTRMIDFIKKRRNWEVAFQLVNKLDFIKKIGVEMHLYFKRGMDWNISAPVSPEELSLLLRFEVMSINNIYFYKQGNHRRFYKVNEFSSGEQSMVLIILHIALNLRNNALICIDEPENSLHPEWQADFIKMIKILSFFTRGCHFIIATHSPQIVSGLNEDGGFVLDVERNITYPAMEYALQSADYQLFKLFQTPGNRNEFVIRNLLVLLTKSSKSIRFSNDEVDILAEIKKQIDEDKITKSDPVFILYEQVNSLLPGRG